MPRTGHRKGATAHRKHPEGVADAASEQVKARLQDAYVHFQQHKEERALFLEADPIMLLGPHAVVGRHVRVFWPAEDDWFQGAPVSATCPCLPEHLC
jgi:hypothetical protein